MNSWKLLVPIFVVFIISSCKKDQTGPATNELLFPKVKSIIQSNCTITYHAPSLGYFDGLPVILETDTDIVKRASAIVEALTGPVTPVNKRMPPDKTLSEDDINVIISWVEKGGQVDD